MSDEPKPTSASDSNAACAGVTSRLVKAMRCQAFAAVAMMLAQPALAQTNVTTAPRSSEKSMRSVPEAKLTPYWTDGAWTVVRGRSTCSVRPKSAWSMSYDGRASKVRLFLYGPGITSLQGDEAHLIEIGFIRRDPPAGISFDPAFAVRAVVLDRNTYLVGDRSSDILRIMKAFDVLAFYTASKTLISAHDLNGSGEAIAKLEECALRAELAHPSDPFSD